MARMYFLNLILLILIGTEIGQGLKILMYSPRFGRSHVMFVGKIADQLAEAGHEIVLYQPIMNKDVEDLVGCKKCRPIERKSDNELPIFDDISRTYFKL